MRTTFHTTARSPKTTRIQNIWRNRALWKAETMVSFRFGHSWHPVPVLLAAPHLRGGDGPSFDEVACRRGQIGTIPSKEILPLAMAHAGKLEKYGA